MKTAFLAENVIYYYYYYQIMNLLKVITLSKVWRHLNGFSVKSNFKEKPGREREGGEGTVRGGEREGGEMLEKYVSA